MRPVLVRLPRRHYDEIRRRAAAQGVPVAQLVRDAVARHLLYR